MPCGSGRFGRCAICACIGLMFVTNSIAILKGSQVNVRFLGKLSVIKLDRILPQILKLYRKSCLITPSLKNSTEQAQSQFFFNLRFFEGPGRNESTGTPHVLGRFVLIHNN